MAVAQNPLECILRQGRRILKGGRPQLIERAKSARDEKPDQDERAELDIEGGGQDAIETPEGANHDKANFKFHQAHRSTGRRTEHKGMNGSPP